MKKLIFSILSAAALIACKPEAYTGPLDSPVGNWDGVKSEFFFNGDKVGELEECRYTAISFYKDGLCCIEGVKGTFPYTYDTAAGMLAIDNTVWKVQTLTGVEFVMEYLETIFPEETPEQTVGEESADDTEEPAGPEVPEAKPDANGIILPTEYEGITIYSDKNGYYYESGDEKTYCNFLGEKNEEGTLIINFWYDRHIDHFIPLVVEKEK